MATTKINMKVEFDSSGFSRGIAEMEKSLDRLRKNMSKSMGGSQLFSDTKAQMRAAREDLKTQENIARKKEESKTNQALSGERSRASISQRESSNNAKIARDNSKAAADEERKKQTHQTSEARKGEIHRSKISNQEKSAEQKRAQSSNRELNAEERKKQAHQTSEARRNADSRSKIRERERVNNLKIAQMEARETTRIAKEAAREQERAAKEAAASQSNAFAGMRSRVGGILNGLKVAALASFAAIGAAATGLGVILGGESGAMKYAMKTENSLANLRNIFGEHAENLQGWLQSNAAKFGMAEAQMLQYGSAYGRMIGRMTEDKGEAVELTKELVKQTAIMAAATGFSKDEVSEKIMSALRGETEAIDDLGINIKIANLERSQAFKEIGKGMKWNDMSGEMQQQIILLNILEQSFNNYGDTMSTTVGSKHSEFISKLIDLKNGLGEAFLPIYATILPSLMEMTAWLRKTIIAFGQFTYALFGNSKGMKEIAKAQKENKAAFKDSYSKQLALASSSQKMADKNKAATKSTKKLTTNVDSVGKSAKKTAKEVKKATASVQGFDTLNKMQAKDTSKSPDIAKDLEKKIKKPEVPKVPEVKAVEPTTFKDSGYDMSKGFLDNKKQEDEYKSMLEQMKEPSEKAKEAAAKAREFGAKLKEIFTTIKEKWTWFKGAIKDLFSRNPETGEIKIVEVLEKLLPGAAGLTAGLGTFFAIQKFAAVADKIKKGLSIIRLAFIGVSWPVVGIVAVVALLAGIFVALWKDSDKFRENVTKIWEGIKEKMVTVWEEFIKPILKDFGEMFKKLWEEHLKPLWGKFKAFMEKLTEFFLVIQEKLDPIINFLQAILMPIFKTVFGVISEVVGFAGGLIGDTIGIIFDVLSGLLDFLIKVFKGDWKGAWDSIKDTFKTIGKSLGNIAINMGNMIIGAFNKILQGAANMVNNIINLIRKIDFDIPDWIPGIGGKNISLGFIPEGKLKAPQIPKIPKLAQGGLIEPRKPRTVIVGDNMYEDEIVSPESKMVNSFKQANKEMFGNGMGGGNTDKLLERVIELLSGDQRLSFDETGFARMTRRSMTRMDRKNGRLT